MGSTELRWHQETHCRRLEDIVREEFESNADMKRLIALSEKPFVSYRDRIFCMRRDTTGDCGEDVDGESLSGEWYDRVISLSEGLWEGPVAWETKELIPKGELTESLLPFPEWLLTGYVGLRSMVDSPKGSFCSTVEERHPLLPQTGPESKNKISEVEYLSDRQRGRSGMDPIFGSVAGILMGSVSNRDDRWLTGMLGRLEYFAIRGRVLRVCLCFAVNIIPRVPRCLLIRLLTLCLLDGWYRQHKSCCRFESVSSGLISLWRRGVRSRLLSFPSDLCEAIVRGGSSVHVSSCLPPDLLPNLCWMRLCIRRLPGFLEWGIFHCILVILWSTSLVALDFRLRELLNHSNRASLELDFCLEEELLNIGVLVRLRSW